MRTIRNQDVPKNTDYNKFPNGGIKNETPTESGTPVIEEIYNDIVQNMYAIVRSAGLPFTEQQDNVEHGFQIVEALKLFSNSLNDVEQVLSLMAPFKFRLNIGFEILPNKYPVFARASESFAANTPDFTIRGKTNNVEYPFSSTTDINSGDELLLIIDQNIVRCYNLSAIAQIQTQEQVFPVLGKPLAYNSSNKLYYFEEGKLLTDFPSLINIEEKLGNFTSLEIKILDCFLIGNFLLCFCFQEQEEIYKFYQFQVNDTDQIVEVEVLGADLNNGENYLPYVYCHGNTVIISNAANASPDDSDFQAFSYDSFNAELSLNGDIVTFAGFVKSTNAVLHEDGNLYSLSENNLQKWNINTGAFTYFYQLNGFAGNLFCFNGSYFYCSGNVAQKWRLNLV